MAAGNGQTGPALVLSAGGARGAYQVGAMKAILERRPQATFSVITGTSIGAVNGAVMAEGIQSGKLAETLARLSSEWLAMEGLLRLNWRSLLAALGSVIRYGPSPKVLQAMRSLLDGVPLVWRLSRLVPPDRRMGDYQKVELVVTTTDLNSGTTVAFDRAAGDVRVIDAVLASAAFPVVFPSRLVAGHWQVDGGVFDHTPLGQVIRRGGCDIFVIGTSPHCGEQGASPQTGPFADIYHVVHRLWPLILDQLLYEDVREARRINEIVSIIEESPNPDSPLIRRLKAAIGYEKEGRRKRVVGIVEICPQAELTPPGTFGFGDRAAIQKIMERGYQDALQVLGRLPPPGVNTRGGGAGRLHGAAPYVRARGRP